MLLTEFMLNSLSADKMSDILFDRFGVNVYEYDVDDMTLRIDTADFSSFNMSPSQFDNFVNTFGWYVSGYTEQSVIIRKNNVKNVQTQSKYKHLYLKGSKIEPNVAKKIGLRAKSYNDLTNDTEDFKVGPIYSNKRNYVWDISTITNFSDLLHFVEVAREYGKYVYLVKLTDEVKQDPEYQLSDEPACFINRTIQPYEIVGGFTGSYVDIAKELQKLI